MLTVITPAVSTALTTIARARALIGFPAADDTAATVLIGQASRVIADHCGRPFGVETVRETLVDNDLWGEGPMLARDPVVGILSVMTNGDVMAPGEYRVSQVGRLQRLDADGRPLPWWGGSLTIDYRAGYVLPNDGNAGSLPETVERAAIMLLSAYLGARGRDPNVKSSSVDGVSSTAWWVPGETSRLISPEAEQLLAPFVRYYP